MMLSFGGFDSEDAIGLAVLDASDNRIADLLFGLLASNYVYRSTAPESPPMGSYGVEALGDPSFEIGDASWSYSGTGRSGDGPKDGSYCVQGVSAPPTLTQYERYAKQDISIAAEDFGTWAVSGWLRRITSDGDNGVNGRARYKLVDPSAVTRYESPVVAHTDWRKYGASIDVDVAGTWQLWFTSFSVSGGGWSCLGYGDLFSLKPVSPKIAPERNRLWLRLRRDASDVYTFYRSDDGVTWKKLHTTDPTGTSVAQLALVFETAQADPRQMAVHYIRQYE
jgi:hypothetical protein